VYKIEKEDLTLLAILGIKDILREEVKDQFKNVMAQEFQ